MPIVLKSGSLNLLEPSGPVQACNGIALPSCENSVLGMVFGSKRDKVTHERKIGSKRDKVTQKSKLVLRETK